MTITTPSDALIPVAPVFANTERLALAGFLAGYSGPGGPPGGTFVPAAPAAEDSNGCPF